MTEDGVARDRCGREADYALAWAEFKRSGV